MERRRDGRRIISADEPLAHAKLRAGAQLRILDASSCGALAETTERLLPGRHLDVHIVTVAGRLLVRARVARAYVCYLRASMIRYRAALAFDQPVDASRSDRTVPAVLAAHGGTDDAQRSRSTDIEFVDRPAA